MVSRLEITESNRMTNHQNDFTILMQNWESVEKYINVAVNSSGEAMEKFESYQDSLAGSIEGFQNAFQSLSNTTVDSGFLTGIVDKGTSVIEFLDFLFEKFGAVNTIVAGFAAGGAIKSIA